MGYGTISNIERGAENVDEQKVFRYLKKLGLDDERKLTKLVRQVEEDIDNLTFQLQQIESMIDNNKSTIAYPLLKNITIESFHPLAPFLNYLQGRYYYAKKDFKKAEKYYKLAIRLCNRYKLNPKDNIVSACHNELSICSYAQNNLTKAEEDVEKGLSVYDENKERKDIKHSLMTNKILYLIRSSQYFEVAPILEETWGLIPQIDSVHVRLNLYKSRAVFLRKMKKYEEAIDVCKEGIDIARRNRSENRQLGLITVLGSVFFLQKRYEKAKQRFQSVLDYDPEGKFPRRKLEAITFLSIIHLHQKNWSEAENQIKEAIEIGRNTTDVYRLTKALIVCGNIYSSQHQYEKAAPFYQEAEFLTEKNGYKERQHTALLQLAYCFGKMNKENDRNILMNKLVDLQRNLNVQSEDEIYGID
ncbi:tetratricopeptide repeat protein [Paenactinomyces guangxiensis]|uniref:Tetratricopeptide repeat protein n=2 Tax=Paenactinomyces guangxiensis TaxID=1490290 RepID=A0A7W2A807_9BACL|nr:tetratricopeptide repeat protein [Paenactinomyces guangxiensis]MBA4493669.1 tetratricopeptide repeat protein [Paenactinomyces guangxiensis]MBH8590956.1 tetratricopeptide repeat protein [Paenactinomyces guangxiensis]